MADTDKFTDTEILALTAVGESDELGQVGMQQTINTVINRVAANKPWMGGDNARNLCLKKGQYDTWDTGTDDRQRIMDIGTNNPTFGPYVIALGLAQAALGGTLPDITNGAVSYGDDGEKPQTHPGSMPCLACGSRIFFDLSAVA
jgi:hypothetical protein